MTRLQRLCPVVAAVFVFGCSDQDPATPLVPTVPESLVFQVSGYMFLPPLGASTQSEGNLGGLSPEVVVCEWDGGAEDGGCVPGSTLASFSTTQGTGGATIKVTADHAYHVNWDTKDTEPGMSIDDQKVYKIAVYLGGQLLGNIDVAIFSNMGQAKNASGDFFALQDGRTLPIKFTIKLPAVLHAANLLDDPRIAGTTDFVVATFSTEGGDQTAFTPSGEAAFKVDGADVVMPDGAGDEFTLLIARKELVDGKCEPTYGGPSIQGCYEYATIPADVRFLADNEPAGVVGVCPDRSVDRSEYRLAKTDAGITVFLTPANDPFFSCAQITSHGLPGILDRLARFFLPRPLYADDEGETGLVGGFSTVHWAVPLAVEPVNAPATAEPGENLALSFRAVQTHGDALAPQDDVRVLFSVDDGELSVDAALTSAGGTVDVEWTAPLVSKKYKITAKVAGTSDDDPESKLDIEVVVGEGLFPFVLAFNSTRDGRVEVYLTDLSVDQGQVQTNLTNNAADDFLPTWSPDATRIAFGSEGRDGNWEIYVMNADGSGQTNLTNHPDLDDARWISWSPDGTRIAFVRGFAGQTDIFVMNADGSGQTNLTGNGAGNTDPTWSPDGTRVLFTSGFHGPTDIFVIDADGQNLINLTADPATDRNARWSPNGETITFNRLLAHGTDIFIMNSDGSGLLNLTDSDSFDESPEWSPDGTRIGFMSTRDNALGDVFVMDADGSNPTNVTNNQASDGFSGPPWSPDGSRIVFTSERDGHREVYIVNADGTGLLKLTDAAENFAARWAPSHLLSGPDE